MVFVESKLWQSVIWAICSQIQYLFVARTEWQVVLVFLLCMLIMMSRNFLVILSDGQRCTFQCDWWWFEIQRSKSSGSVHHTIHVSLVFFNPQHGMNISTYNAMYRQVTLTETLLLLTKDLHGENILALIIHYWQMSCVYF